MNGYRVITSASKRIMARIQPGLTKGGVSILVHTERAQYISNIHRVGRRIMTTTLHDIPRKTPIAIAVTYAPHMGYRKKEKRNTGGETRDIIDQILKDT